MRSLQDRIRAGELEAFLDPELPLLLLAEPGAEWWRAGVASLPERIARDHNRMRWMWGIAKLVVDWNERTDTERFWLSLELLRIELTLSEWPDDVARALEVIRRYGA